MSTWYLITKKLIEEEQQELFINVVKQIKKCMHDYDEITLQKLHNVKISILTINTDGLYRNHFLDINVYAWFYFQLHKNSDYPLIVDVDYPEYLPSQHRDLPFLPERNSN